MSRNAEVDEPLRDLFGPAREEVRMARRRRANDEEARTWSIASVLV